MAIPEFGAETVNGSGRRVYMDGQEIAQAVNCPMGPSGYTVILPDGTRIESQRLPTEAQPLRVTVGRNRHERRKAKAMARR